MRRPRRRASGQNPSPTSAPPKRVHQRCQRSHVIRQLLTLVAQGLNIGLRRRIGDGQPANLPLRYGNFVITGTDPPCNKPNTQLMAG